jgi:NitT/TauT family transport system substrate-binding protein
MNQRLIFVCTVALFCTTSCERPSTNSSSTSTSLQLNWLADAQHGGFFAASSNLREAEPPWELTIRPGGPGTPVLPQLVMGKVDFAIANADQVLLARAQGADVVALFAPFQNSPRCIMVHSESDLYSLSDFHDITLAMGEGKAYAEFLKAHTSWSNVRIVAYTGTVARFMLEPDFAQQAYSFSEPLVVAQKGIKTRCLMVSEIGFNPYTSLLVAHRDLMKRDPERVQRVVSAVRQGWTEYLRSPADVHDTIERQNPDMDRTVLDESVSEVRKLCLPEDMPTEQLGRMSEERWSTLAQQLLELNLIDSAEVANGAFTNAYLD